MIDSARAANRPNNRSQQEDTRRRVIDPELVRRLREFIADVETVPERKPKNDQTNRDQQDRPSERRRNLAMRDRFKTVFGGGKPLDAKVHEFDQVVAEYNFRRRSVANTDLMQQRRTSEQRQLVVQAIESSYCEQQATLGELGTFTTRVVECIVTSVQTPEGPPSNGKEVRDRACDHLLAELKLPTFEQIVSPYPQTTGKQSPLTLLENARGQVWRDDLAIARSFRQQILDRGVETSIFGLMRIEKDLQTAKSCAFRHFLSDASRPTSIVWRTNDSFRVSCDRVRHEAQLEDVIVYPYDSIRHARGVNVPIRISRLLDSVPDCLRPMLELVAGTVVAERFVRYAEEDGPWTRTQNVDPALTLFRNYVVASKTDLDEPEFPQETGNG